jgi:hypothetical protein
MVWVQMFHNAEDFWLSAKVMFHATVIKPNNLHDFWIEI